MTKDIEEGKFFLRAYSDGKGVEVGTFSTRFSLVAVSEDSAQKLRTLRGPKK